jgi:hypothetical protein
LMLPQQAFLLVRSLAARSVSSHFAHSRRVCLQTGRFQLVNWLSRPSISCLKYKIPPNPLRTTGTYRCFGGEVNSLTHHYEKSYKPVETNEILLLAKQPNDELHPATNYIQLHSTTSLVVSPQSSVNLSSFATITAPIFLAYELMSDHR